jgi:hypothetical protein
LQEALAQAKNGDKFFWEEKFRGANGNAQACTQRALFCFLLSLGGGKAKDIIFSIFPWFQMCSHNVPFKFSTGSHHVLNVFPNMFSVAPHFLSHML